MYTCEGVFVGCVRVWESLWGVYMEGSLWGVYTWGGGCVVSVVSQCLHTGVCASALTHSPPCTTPRGTLGNAVLRAASRHRRLHAGGLHFP